MNIFDFYTKLLLESFNKNEVEYIIVGGYAVNFHGYIRTTGDIDLWFKPTNTNKIKILKAFQELEVPKESVITLEKMDFTTHLHFTDGKEPFKIDFMNFVSGINFEDAWKKKIMTEFDDLLLPFIEFEHLILTKITSERLKDKLDVEELQKIKFLKNNI